MSGKFRFKKVEKSATVIWQLKENELVNLMEKMETFVCC